MNIRPVGPGDVSWVIAMIRRLLEEMATHGGHAVAVDEAPWRTMADDVAAGLADPGRCTLVAEDPAPIGVVAARIAGIDDVFAPIRSLHLSVVYVVPAARRRGIARRLCMEALDWGRAAGCTRADLHVLAANPARALYEQLGFRPFELELVRPL